jgi:hypothetical protein
MMRSMKRAALDRMELEYEIRGAGEPIVLVHHGSLSSSRVCGQ